LTNEAAGQASLNVLNTNGDGEARPSSDDPIGAVQVAVSDDTTGNDGEAIDGDDQDEGDEDTFDQASGDFDNDNPLIAKAAKKVSRRRKLPAGHKYEDWIWRPLKEELQKRGLKIAGKKEELMARLLEDDRRAEEGIPPEDVNEAEAVTDAAPSKYSKFSHHTVRQRANVVTGDPEVDTPDVIQHAPAEAATAATEVNKPAGEVPEPLSPASGSFEEASRHAATAFNSLIEAHKQEQRRIRGALVHVQEEHDVATTKAKGLQDVVDGLQAELKEQKTNNDEIIDAFKELLALYGKTLKQVDGYLNPEQGVTMQTYNRRLTDLRRSIEEQIAYVGQTGLGIL